MSSILRGFLIAALGLSLGCGEQLPTIDMAAEHASLLETDQAWAAAAAAGDVKQLATFWAEDAVNYFPGAAPAVGLESIIKLVQRNRRRPGFALSWQPEQAVVSRLADMGYTTGPFEMTFNDPDGNPQVRRGHYVSIWKKMDDGSWKCAVETTIYGPRPRPRSPGS